MRLSPNKLNQKTPRVAKPQGEKLLGGIMPISFFVPEDGSGPRFAGLSDYRAPSFSPGYSPPREALRTFRSFLASASA